MRVQQAREHLLDAGNQRHPGPHLEATIPFALLDQELTAVFVKQKPVKLALPLAGRVADSLPTLTLVPKSLSLQKGKQEALGLNVTIGVELNKSGLFDLVLDTDFTVAIAESGGKFGFAVDGKHLQSVRPKLPSDAGKKLTTHIWPLLPRLVRTGLSKKAFAKQLRSVMKVALERDFSVAALPLLKSAGTLAKGYLTTGNAPIEGLALRVNAKAKQLVVVAGLDLPGATTLPPDPTFVASSHRAAIRVAGGTLAALGNDAMARGKIPRRYTAAGKPDSNGAFVAALSFARGSQPLRVHLFREAGECVGVTLAGRPTLSVKKGRLHFGIADARVVDTTGSALVKAAVWLKSLWSKAVSMSRSQAASTKLAIAGKQRTFAIKKAGYADGVFRFDVTVK